MIGDWNIEDKNCLAIVEQNPNGSGIVWGGQREMVDRLLQGYDASLPGIVQSTRAALDYKAPDEDDGSGAETEADAETADHEGKLQKGRVLFTAME